MLNLDMKFLSKNMGSKYGQKLLDRTKSWQPMPLRLTQRAQSKKQLKHYKIWLGMRLLRRLPKLLQKTLVKIKKNQWSLK